MSWDLESWVLGSRDPDSWDLGSLDTDSGILGSLDPDSWLLGSGGGVGNLSLHFFFLLTVIWSVGEVGGVLELMFEVTSRQGHSRRGWDRRRDGRD